MAGKGTELANAYVTLIPSLRGAEKAIEKELAGVDVTGAGKRMGKRLGEAAGKAAGDDASDGIERGVEKADTKSSGKRLGAQLGSAMTDALHGSFDISSVTDILGEVVPDSVTEKLGGLGETGSKALGIITSAAPIAGAAVAAIGAVAIDAATDFDTAEARITAAVGGVGEEADALKEAGRDLYTDGWGEIMTQLSDSLINAREILGDISSEDMSGAVEGALALEEVYGSDFSETLRGARVLMEKFGLSSEEAMDLMVAGTQRGLDYTDELGDNLSEYAGRWADAGIEASEYFSLLEAGADNGAYSLDKVGDFLNEFLTSLSDGRMDEAIGNFSESTQKTFEAFKSGGADAQDVLDAVVGELAEMPDGYEKAQIASELWSSLGEDNAMSMIESLGNVEDTFDDVAGASEEMTEQVSDDLGSKWDSAIRKWQDLLEPVGEVAVDAFGGLADLLGGAAEGIDNLVGRTQRIADIGKSFESMGESTKSALESMGYDLGELEVGLADAGVSVEELEKIGSGHIRSLATAFNGDVDSMIWSLKNYNNTPFVDKDSTVSVNDAELIDAQGRVVTWNGTTLVYKGTNVQVDEGDLMDAQGKVYTWNGTVLEYKSASANIYGNLSSALTLASRWNSVSLRNKSAGVYINNSAALMASGGVIPHADGFIATGPTMISPHHMVGEAGAEAVFDYGGSTHVVPLTNRKYSQPFADIVAEGVAKVLGARQQGGGAGVTVSGNTFVVRGDSDINEIARELYVLMGRKQRSW